MIAVENSGLKKISREQAESLETLSQMSDDMLNQLADLYEEDTTFRKKLDLKARKDGKGGALPKSLTEDEKYNESARRFMSGDKSLQADLARLQKKMITIQEYIDARDDSFSEIKKAVKAKEEKEKCMPTRWPITGAEFSSGFGYRGNPFGGYSGEFHDGIDLACASGTPIYSAGKGVVIEAGYDAGYGLVIKIDHGYGYVTTYSHCARLLAETGDKVKAHEQIATVGSTGRTTGPHLHYQLIKNGKVIDPMELLD